MQQVGKILFLLSLVSLTNSVVGNNRNKMYSKSNGPDLSLNILGGLHCYKRQKKHINVRFLGAKLNSFSLPLCFGKYTKMEILIKMHAIYSCCSNSGLLLLHSLLWYLQPKYCIIVLVHESRTDTMKFQNDKREVKSFDCVQQKNWLKQS